MLNVPIVHFGYNLPQQLCNVIYCFIALAVFRGLRPIRKDVKFILGTCKSNIHEVEIVNPFPHVFINRLSSKNTA